MSSRNYGPPKQKGRPARHFSIVEKRAVLTAFLITGSVQKASDETVVPRETIYRWTKKDWWHEWQEDITAQLGHKLTARMRGVALKAYDQLDERLNEGDINTYKDEWFRAPVNAKDLSMIGNIASDKMRLAEGKATQRHETVDLNAAAQTFEAIADKYMDKIGQQMSGVRPVIEGEAIKVALPGDK